MATAFTFFQNPNLWVQALQWIAEKGDAAKPDDMAEILGMIERHHLMSPLLVTKGLFTQSDRWRVSYDTPHKK
jgi:hypothetical protein